MKGQQSPFKYLNWKDGNFLFDYLRYDRVHGGPVDFNDFQVSDLTIKRIVQEPKQSKITDSLK